MLYQCSLQKVVKMISITIFRASCRKKTKYHFMLFGLTHINPKRSFHSLSSSKVKHFSGYSSLISLVLRRACTMYAVTWCKPKLIKEECRKNSFYFVKKKCKSWNAFPRIWCKSSCVCTFVNHLWHIFTYCWKLWNLVFRWTLRRSIYCTLCRLHVSKGTIRTKMRLGDVNI